MPKMELQKERRKMRTQPSGGAVLTWQHPSWPPDQRLVAGYISSVNLGLLESLRCQTRLVGCPRRDGHGQDILVYLYVDGGGQEIHAGAVTVCHRGAGRFEISGRDERLVRQVLEMLKRAEPVSRV